MRSRLVLLLKIASISIWCFCSIALAQDAKRQGSHVRAGDHQKATGSFSGLHDLSGIWVLESNLLSLSGDAPPMTAEGKGRFDSNKPSYGPKAVPSAESNDPLENCDPLGMPRLLFYVAPIEFLQTPNRIVQFFEYHEAWRNIWMDAKALSKDPDPRWMGYSQGRWDDNTLIVESNGFDERSWIDKFGNPHSEQMTIEERWRRVDSDTLELTMTLTDPEIYTRPWVSDKKIFIRSRLGMPPTWLAEPAPAEKLQGLPMQKELDEMFCVPSEEQAFNRRIRDPAQGKHDQ